MSHYHRNPLIPGQGPRLVLGVRNLHSDVRVDTSAFSELTRPPVPRTAPIIPGGEHEFRRPEEIGKGLGLGYDQERDLARAAKDWMAAPNVVAFRKSLIEGLRTMAPTDHALRGELQRRALQVWKSTRGGYPSRSYERGDVIQKAEQLDLFGKIQALMEEHGAEAVQQASAKAAKAKAVKPKPKAPPKAKPKPKAKAKPKKQIKGTAPVVTGWEPIPGGKHGGQRRRRGNRWQHRYPDGKGGYSSSPVKPEPKAKAKPKPETKPERKPVVESAVDEPVMVRQGKPATPGEPIPPPPAEYQAPEEAWQAVPKARIPGTRRRMVRGTWRYEYPDGQGGYTSKPPIPAPKEKRRAPKGVDRDPDSRAAARERAAAATRRREAEAQRDREEAARRREFRAAQREKARAKAEKQIAEQKAKHAENVERVNKQLSESGEFSRLLEQLGDSKRAKEVERLARENAADALTAGHNPLEVAFTTIRTQVRMDREAELARMDSDATVDLMGEVEETNPDKSPAIQKARDLLPTIPDAARLPDDVRRFPNPTEKITELYSHQIEGAERIRRAWLYGDGALLSDDAGLGKTNIALAAMRAQGGKRNLIVVPTSGKDTLKAQWSGETAAGLYGIDLKGVAVEKDKKGGQRVINRMDELSATEPGWYIISYDEMTRPVLGPDGKPLRKPPTKEQAKKGKEGDIIREPRPELFDGQWDTIAFDEAHNMVNPNTITGQNGKNLMERADKVLYMTATPFTNITDMNYLSKLGMWDHYRGQEVEFGTKKELAAKQKIETDEQAFAHWAALAGANVKAPKYDAIKNPSSLMPMSAIAATMHVDGLAIKRTTSMDGVKSQFGTIAQNDLTEEQKGAFENVRQMIAFAISDGGFDPFIAEGLYKGWARQYWEIIKADRAVDLGKAALAEGKQVAIFTEYRTAEHAHIAAIPRMIHDRALKLMESEARHIQARGLELERVASTLDAMFANLPKVKPAVETLVEAFGGSSKVAEIHGSTTKTPAGEQEKYQSGKAKVCVATMSKGGTGISLHDTEGDAPRVQINLSLPWSGRVLTQVAGRSHRLGSKSDTEMHWLLGEDDSELHLASIVGYRLRKAGSLTAGDPELSLDQAALAQFEMSMADSTESGEKLTGMLLEDEAMSSFSGKAAIDVQMEVEAASGGKKERKTLEEREEEGRVNRDWFREFGERRKEGRNVLQERYDEAQIRKRQLKFRESRRAAAQLRQELGWEINWRPGISGGVFEIEAIYKRVGGKLVVDEDQRKPVKSAKVGGKGRTYGTTATKSYWVPYEGMEALAEKMNVHKAKVNLRATSAEDLDPSKRTDHQQLIDELALHNLRVQDAGNGYYKITGKTWDNKSRLRGIARCAKDSDGYYYTIHGDHLEELTVRVGGKLTEAMEAKRQEKAKEKAEAMKAADAALAKMDLRPIRTGSIKQIDYAEAIRDKALRILSGYKSAEADQLRQRLMYEDRSKFFLDSMDALGWRDGTIDFAAVQAGSVAAEAADRAAEIGESMQVKKFRKGSSKQKAWAEKIRHKALGLLAQSDDPKAAELTKQLLAETDAKWVIDARWDLGFGRDNAINYRGVLRKSWDAQLEQLRPRMRLRLSQAPLELVWMAEEIPDELHTDQRRHAPGWPQSDGLEKGAQHKYLKRLPTGKPKPKWRYIYQHPKRKGLTASDDLKAGAKFQVEHAGQLGHFEVQGHDEHNGIVTLKHDESGKVAHIRERDLHRMIASHHGKKTERAKEEPKPKPKPLKLRREEQQPRLPGTEAKARKPKKEEPEAAKASEAPKTPAPKLPRATLDDLGKGGYDSIEGFAADARDLEAQAVQLSGDREYAVIPQTGGFVLASRGKTEKGAKEAKGETTHLLLRGSGGKSLQKLEAEYVVLEASDLIASHDPETFSKRSEYPEGVQERGYEVQGSGDQGKIDRIAREMEPSLVVNTNPDAINGTPMVTEGGIVLGGNGRTMGMQRAYALYPEKAAQMKAHLQKNARAFGVSAAQVAGMKQPILVRRLKVDKSDEKALGRRMNEPLTQGMDPRTIEVSLGQNYVTPELLDSLSHNMDADQSLSEFLRSTRSRPFVRALERSGIIDQYNKDEFVDRDTQTLNEDGRMRVERVLTARMIPDASVLSRMGTKLRQTIARSVPALISMERGGWNVQPALELAVRADNDMKLEGFSGGKRYSQKAGKKITIPNDEHRREYLKQTSLMGGDLRSKLDASPLAKIMLEAIQDQANRQMPGKWRQVALEADRQNTPTLGGFIDKRSPEQVITETFQLQGPAKPKPKAPEAEGQTGMFALSMPAPDLLKAEISGSDLSRYLMHAVLWELDNLMRAAVGEGEPLSGAKLLSKLKAFIAEQAKADDRFAWSLGAHPLTDETLRGLIRAAAQARVTDLAKSLARRQLQNGRRHAGECSAYL